MFGLMNNELMNTGKVRLGFLNPTLHALHKTTPRAFVDITEGNNAKGAGCFGFTVSCPSSAGFDAAVGWDGPNFRAGLHPLPYSIPSNLGKMPAISAVPTNAPPQTPAKDNKRYITEGNT